MHDVQGTSVTFRVCQCMYMIPLFNVYTSLVPIKQGIYRAAVEHGRKSWYEVIATHAMNTLQKGGTSNTIAISRLP